MFYYFLEYQAQTERSGSNPRLLPRCLRFSHTSLLRRKVANAYEATHIDNPNGIMYVVSWLFAAAGVVGFLAFLVIAISERFSKD